MSGQCELRKCQVRIDGDAANVLMVAIVEDGKVQSLAMRIDDFCMIQ